MTIRRLWVVALALAVGACSGESTEPVVEPAMDDVADVASLEVSPNVLTLEAPADRAKLQATAYDANGQPLRVPITWSSESTDISVDGDGVVGSPNGQITSGRVLATVGELTASSFVMMVHAKPGALFYDDDQVTSAAEGVWNADKGVMGSQIRLGLTGVDLKVGDLLIPRGESLGMGRVASVSGDEVTLNIVRLTTLIEDLSIDFVTDEPEIPTPRKDEFELAGFECEAEHDVSADLNLDFSMPDPTLTMQVVERDLKFDIWSASVSRFVFVVRGDATAEVRGTLSAPVTVGTKLKCEKDEVFKKAFKLPGLMGKLFSLTVPVGLGASLDLQGSVSTVDATADGRFGGTASVGLEYNAGPGWLDRCDMSLSHDTSLRVRTGTIADGHLQGNVKIYVTTGIDFRPVLFPEATNFKQIRVGMGLSHQVDLKAIEAQAADADYASNYLLGAFGQGKYLAFNNFVVQWLDLPGLGGIEIESDAIPLEPSPTGSLALPDGPFVPEQSYPLEVTLSDYEFLGEPNVEQVRIYRVQDDAVTLAAVAAANAFVINSDGTHTYQVPWTPTAENAGSPFRLVPAVQTRLLPTPLETKPDSAHTVCVEQVPAAYTISTVPNLDIDSNSTLLNSYECSASETLTGIFIAEQGYYHDEMGLVCASVCDPSQTREIYPLGETFSSKTYFSCPSGQRIAGVAYKDEDNPPDECGSPWEPDCPKDWMENLTVLCVPEADLSASPTLQYNAGYYANGNLPRVTDCPGGGEVVGLTFKGMPEWNSDMLDGVSLRCREAQ